MQRKLPFKEEEEEREKKRKKKSMWSVGRPCSGFSCCVAFHVEDSYLSFPMSSSFSSLSSSCPVLDIQGDCEIDRWMFLKLDSMLLLPTQTFLCFMIYIWSIKKNSKMSLLFFPDLEFNWIFYWGCVLVHNIGDVSIGNWWNSNVQFVCSTLSWGKIHEMAEMSCRWTWCIIFNVC